MAKKAPNRSDMVRIEHPKTEGSATVLYAAFEDVWKDKGWKVVDGAKDKPTTTAAASSDN